MDHTPRPGRIVLFRDTIDSTIFPIISPVHKDFNLGKFPVRPGLRLTFMVDFISPLCYNKNVGLY